MDELAIIELFCAIDDFCHRFHHMCCKNKIEYFRRKVRKKTCRTSLNQVLTILLLFHLPNYKTFKHFYLIIQIVLKNLFRKLVGYFRFAQLTAGAFFPMFCFMKECQSHSKEIFFLDSTILTVCHVKRASSHRIVI